MIHRKGMPQDSNFARQNQQNLNVLIWNVSFTLNIILLSTYSAYYICQ